MNSGHREHDRPGSARFAWRALALTAILSLLCPLMAVAQTPSSLYLPAPEAFTTDSHVVSTTVFHWFTATDGQLSGPWAPLEGRASWTGDPAFWQDQVKQIMSANIDIMYVHLLPSFEQQRINLFQALNQLRAQGYDVPKVAPILDPVTTWYNQPNVDLATTASGGDGHRGKLATIRAAGHLHGGDCYSSLHSPPGTLALWRMFHRQ